MAGRHDNYRNKAARQSKIGPRILAASIGFCTVFALSYVTTNVGREQRFPHPVTCPSELKGWLSSTKKPKIHVLLISYPRSGSSFLGDLLQSYSGAFYHFEPLHYFGSVVSNNQLSSARKLVHDLLTCDYHDWSSFPEWAWFHSDFLTLRRNKRYWETCTNKDHSRMLCYNVCFLSSACRQSPVQIAKTIRMTVSEASKLLEEYKDLNLKIIHLVRDPRGTMNSRKQKDIATWCSRYKACSNADTFCKLVEDDLKNACILQLRHPNRYMLVRYEDLALDPPQTTERLFSFLGLGPVPDEVVQFLETHTQHSPPANSKSFLQPPYRTVRNSTQAALEWSRRMNLKDILRIQRYCHSVLEQVGYKMVANNSELNAEDVLKETSPYCETM